MTGRQEAIAQLDVVLECRAHNLDQERLLVGDNQERGLAIHIAALLRDGADPADVGELTRICRELLESNLAEGQEECRLAALVESFIARQLAAPVEQRVRVKALAAKLRPALRVVAGPARGETQESIAFFQASCTVRDVIAQTAPEHLLCRSMEHELGHGPFGLLCDLVEGMATEEASA